MQSTRIQRDGGLYLMEVPDRLTIDRLSRRVRAFGYLSDGSFSGAFAKTPEGVLILLAEDLSSSFLSEGIRTRLVEAGMVDSFITGAVKPMLGN